MDRSQPTDTAPAGGHVIIKPEHQRFPIVLASPHSGRNYPRTFVESSRLSPLALRKSEDAFVDDLLTPAIALGVPIIKALFPRAYLDLNREPYELDPDMFRDPLPDYANTRSPRVAAGLGTVARIVANGEPIYRFKMPAKEGLERVEQLHRPYHTELSALIEETRQKFGYAILVDCHSMPSTGIDPAGTRERVDVIFGDCFGSSCSPDIINRAEFVTRQQGLVVHRNTPYAGGYTTRHYGRPSEGIHAIQIEVNRDLYMDEKTFFKSAGFDRTASALATIIEQIATTELLAKAAE